MHFLCPWRCNGGRLGPHGRCPGTCSVVQLGFCQVVLYLHHLASSWVSHRHFLSTKFWSWQVRGHLSHIGRSLWGSPSLQCSMCPVCWKACYDSMMRTTMHANCSQLVVLFAWNMWCQPTTLGTARNLKDMPICPTDIPGPLPLYCTYTKGVHDDKIANAILILIKSAILKSAIPKTAC